MTTDTSSDGADAPPPPSGRSSRPPDRDRTSASSSTSWTEVAYVGRPHGLDGSFHAVNAEPGVLALGVETSLGVIVRCAGTQDRPILRVEGVETRAAAEALRGEAILAELDLGDDEYWAEDLVGLPVFDGDREVGTVARVRAYPSCEVLEVGDLLIPLIDDAVREVDLEAGRIDVDLEFLGAG